MLNKEIQFTYILILSNNIINYIQSISIFNKYIKKWQSVPALYFLLYTTSS